MSVHGLLHSLYGYLGMALSIMALALAYFAALAYRAWYEAKNAPREVSFTCDKHGVFPMRFTIKMPMPDGGEDYPICPFCYEDAIKQADAKLRAQEGNLTKVR